MHHAERRDFDHVRQVLIQIGDLERRLHSGPLKMILEVPADGGREAHVVQDARTEIGHHAADLFDGVPGGLPEFADSFRRRPV